MESIVERPARIPESLWESLSQDAKIVIYGLCEEIRELRDQIRDIGGQAKQNSSNSSLPPSSDRPWSKPVRKKKVRGRKRGGQKGHLPHVRPLIPPERVQHSEDHYPTACRHCSHELQADDEGADEPYRHQVLDLPEIVPLVNEHRLHYRMCPDCKKRTRAALPAGVPRSNFGPTVGALMAVLAVGFHLSKRQVKSLLQVLLGVDIGLGTIVDAEKLASEALAGPVDEVHEALKHCDVVYQDESKWPEAGKNGYVWITASGPYAYYEIARSRSGEVARSLLGGAKFNGYAVTDRYSGYRCYPMERRGICHSHLIRDYQKIADRSEDVKPIGEGLLKLEHAIFKAWHAFKDGKIDRPDLQQQLVDIAIPYEGLLLQGIRHDDSKVAGMCANIYDHWEAIWNFGWVEGMEPTNNEGERTVRHLVVFRKKSYGTQSSAGSLYVGRMATVVETCRRQGLNLLQYVSDAIRAHIGGLHPPSLIVANSS